MFCSLKNIFGKEGEGIHSYRLFNIAIVDLLGTIAISMWLSYIFKYSFYHILFLLLISSLILHKLFCVNTTFTKMVFQ